jgi:LacI family transcriptional regulator, galactose operon repressor
MQREARRVLLVLGWYDYRLHRGIERYASEHGWHLSEDLAREKVVPWGWDGSGILAWLGAGDDLAGFVEQANKPTVDFSFRRPHLPFARVLEDTDSAGRLAAGHFLERGFKHFMYYSDADNWVYEERGQAFVDALKQAGQECRWLRWHESAAFRRDRSEWKRKRAWLAEHMKKSPKPLAVFCAADGLALDLLESCESARVAVPENVSIVGAGNSLLAVDALRIPISSVDTSLETLGYRGAALLDELMAGRPTPKSPLRVAPAGLIARKSSDLVAVDHPGLAKALRFLLDHCHELISVDDIVTAAGMSRRSLHEAFLAHLGRPPGAELHRIRMEHAKKMLLESDDKIEAIAEKCGYQSGNSFWVAFKQAVGMSPREYKKRVAAQSLRHSRPRQKE